MNNARQSAGCRAQFNPKKMTVARTALLEAGLRAPCVPCGRNAVPAVPANPALPAVHKQFPQSDEKAGTAGTAIEPQGAQGSQGTAFFYHRGHRGHRGLLRRDVRERQVIFLVHNARHSSGCHAQFNPNKMTVARTALLEAGPRDPCVPCGRNAVPAVPANPALPAVQKQFPQSDEPAEQRLRRRERSTESAATASLAAHKRLQTAEASRDVHALTESLLTRAVADALHPVRIYDALHLATMSVFRDALGPVVAVSLDDQVCARATALAREHYTMSDSPFVRNNGCANPPASS